jgi:hypothetical protein
MASHGNYLPNSHFSGKSPTSMDMFCLATKCPVAMAEAMIEPTFIKMSECELGCNPFYYNDTTPMKLLY